MTIFTQLRVLCFLEKCHVTCTHTLLHYSLHDTSDTTVDVQYNDDDDEDDLETVPGM